MQKDLATIEGTIRFMTPYQMYAVSRARLGFDKLQACLTALLQLWSYHPTYRSVIVKAQSLCDLTLSAYQIETTRQNPKNNINEMRLLDLSLTIIGTAEGPNCELPSPRLQRPIISLLALTQTYINLQSLTH
jgi:hypothetical protein